MMGNLEAKISAIYNEKGLFEAFNYIMSSEQTYLFPRHLVDKNLSKAKELALLGKGERTLIRFINNSKKDKKRSVVGDVDVLYNSTIERKLSPSTIKLLKSKVKNLSSERVSYYKSFNNVIEFDREGLQNKSVKIKLSKIYALYSASVHKNIDYKAVTCDLASYGIKMSKQDLYAFISLVLQMEKGKYFRIPYNLWCAFFGERNVNGAKSAFDKLGLITLVYEALPGFKSALYRLKLPSDKSSDFVKVKITSIRTLEKLGRIKFFKPRFWLSDKIKALKALTKLYAGSFESTEVGSRKNLTSVFLGSGIFFGGLISDLETIQKVFDGSMFVKDAHYLASYINSFLYKVNRGNFTRYMQFDRVKKDEVINDVNVLLSEFDVDDEYEISEEFLDAI
ncbi:hypothetical protein [uncultured Lutibacter sp.]|uniref:hypothetical protein n=1 Tax=uncultured Lutibacter sp. TaxID=437739 RepID=UPI002608A145|nr:hypothetical protein [uncultured Lutibacter sp.]